MNHFYQQTHRLALRSRILFLCLLASLAALPAFAQTSWKGTTNSDWNTATNWSAGVPTATSDVTIPNVTNKPIIGAATTALVKSVEVQSGAVLTISSSATLAVNGTNNVPGSTAFLNFGTVHNNGQLNLGNTASTGEHGLSNGLGAIFNNNAGGTITIDRSGQGGLDNRILTQTAIFTNAGGIIIGATENVGHWGLRNTATFNNQAGGTITSDRSTDYGLQNVTGTFTNAGVFTIGAIAAVGANGIQNSANFANNGCTGIIRIVSNSTIVNINPGTFTNSGTIIENATGNSNISSN